VIINIFEHKPELLQSNYPKKDEGKIMNMKKNIPATEQETGALDWTAGPIMGSHNIKGFDHSGMEIRVVAQKMYQLEIFPPRGIAKFMEHPAPDICHHLEEEGVDIQHFHRRHVSFIAHVSLPVNLKDACAKITLKSEQRQNGGVYEQEICIPAHMICIRASAQETVLASLNNALHNHRWYPPY